MKKLIVLSAITAAVVLMWGFFASAQAQEPTKEEKPTFYRLIPGVYVNGWPRFTVTYPKDWVEFSGRTIDAFRAGAPGPGLYYDFGVVIWQSPLPLEKFVDINLNVIRAMSTEVVTVVSDKPSQLRDGTPARENELHYVVKGVPTDTLGLATKKGDMWVALITSTTSGKIGEDLKAILYSIEFQAGKDEPVKVPADVQEFLDKWCNDFVAHDLAKVMTHVSDRFLNSGVKKGEIERNWRQIIDSITSMEIGITDFEGAGDRAYLTGVWVNSFIGKAPLRWTSIIKENGEWKWYGNQRNARPPR
jgi:hypothetical protein